MTIEQQISNQMFNQNAEKTYIDKLLSKQEVSKIQEIMKKEKLTRSEILNLLYLIAGTESKLHNFSEWDRYIVLKLYVWIREFIKDLELFYDYKDKLNLIREDGNPKIKLTKISVDTLNNTEMLLQHNAKFLVDLYLNICRTSLSVGASGFLELLKSKFEISYPNLTQQQPDYQSRGFLGMGKK